LRISGSATWRPVSGSTSSWNSSKLIAADLVEVGVKVCVGEILVEGLNGVRDGAAEKAEADETPEHEVTSMEKMAIKTIKVGFTLENQAESYLRRI
jgi:hypothetical protein